jgi:replicative DNA helicase
MSPDVQPLPHAIQAEKSILSTLIRDPEEWFAVAAEESLIDVHFYIPAHSVMFKELESMHDERGHCELIEFTQRMIDKGRIEDLGGPSAITDIYTYAPTHGHFRQHLKMVKEKFILRQLLASATDTVERVNETPEDPQAVLDATEAQISAIRETCEKQETGSVRTAILEVITELEDRLSGKSGPPGIMTGFEDLDRMTDGLKPGELFTVGARPSMGKSAFMGNVVENVCLDQGEPCMIFSLEMSRKSLVSRMLYSMAKVNSRAVSMGFTLNLDERRKIEREALRIQNSRLVIDDTASISITSLRSKARRQKRRGGLSLIAVDYLQLMRSTSKQASGNREREIAEISAGLKSLAKELEIPIIALCQLNRQSTDRKVGKAGKGASEVVTKRGIPKMSDLRESGAIEQDADYIGLLHRPIYFAETDEERADLEGVATLMLVKNRNGQTGDVNLTFIDQYAKFVSGKPYVPKAAEVQGERGRFSDR